MEITVWPSAATKIRLPRRSMPTPVRHTRVTPPSVNPHSGLLGSSFKVGVQAPVPDDRREALAGPRDVRSRVRAAAPLDDVDATVAIADECGFAVLQRLVDAAVDGRAVFAVFVGEAAVEGREQPPALAVGHHRRPAHGRVGWLVAARVVADRGACVVEPGHVGEQLRIFGFGAEGRHQHRWAAVDRRPCRFPDPFPGQRMREHRLDRRRPGRRLLCCAAGPARPPAGASAPVRPSSALSRCSRCARCRRRSCSRRAHRLSPTRRCGR